MATIGRKPWILQRALRLPDSMLDAVRACDDQFVRVGGRDVDERSAARDGIVAAAAAARQLHRDAFHERNRRSDRRILEVEGRREQRRASAEDHVSVRVTRGSAGQQLRDRTVVPMVGVNVSRRFEEHRSAIWPHLRLAPRCLARQRLDASPFRRNDVQMRIRAIGEHDAIVRPPACAGRVSRRRGDVDRRAAAGWNPFQATVGEEPNPLAVPGEEWARFPFGASERCGLETIERAVIQALPVLVTGRDDDRPTVR